MDFNPFDFEVTPEVMDMTLEQFRNLFDAAMQTGLSNLSNVREDIVKFKEVTKDLPGPVMYGYA